MIKFRSVFERCEASKLNQIDAAALLGVSERTSAGGACALKTAGRPAYWTVVWAKPRTGGYRRSGNSRSMPCIGPGTTASPPSTSTNTWCARIRSAGATTWPKVFLQSRGLLPPAKTRAAHRRKRPRRPLPGMMLHPDGSRHEWVAGIDAMGLIVTMDDATNTIYSGFLVPEEGIASTLQALLEVFGRHGLPLSLYSDRGSHHFYTPEAGGPVTQLGRAPQVVFSTCPRASLAQLGVEHIAAYSPRHAGGRSVCSEPCM
jgi:hypothetical protein